MNNNDIDLHDFAAKIENIRDFQIFLKMLNEDHEAHSNEWENNDLTSYLGALAGFVYDTKSVNEQPSWRLFARMLLAAIVYE